MCNLLCSLSSSFLLINTEVKKIIHTLEDEQKATYNFTENTVTKSPTLNPPTSITGSQKIIHVLEEDVLPTKPKMDLVATNSIIESMPVVFEEVLLNTASEDDFIITDALKVEEKIEEETKPKLLKALYL